MNKKIKIFSLAITSLLIVGCNKDKIERHVHSYSDEWSYNSNGHYHKCTFIGCSNTSDIEEHVFVDNVCSICGYNKTENCSHNWSIWSTTKAPTTTADGEKKRTCSKCGAEEVAPIKYGDEFDGSWVATKETHYMVDNRGTRISAPEPHNLVDYEGDATHVNQPATCEKAGVQYKKCVVCSKVVSQEIKKLEHDFVDYDGDSTYVNIPATTTSAGVQYKKCTLCGKILAYEIPMLGTSTSGFTFNSDITTPQKIHTTDQENFLKYNKGYYNITSSELNSYNAKGNAENSFPNQVTVTWNYTAPSGKIVRDYNFVTGQRSNLSDAYSIPQLTNTRVSFYNPFIGTNYFKIVANFTDGSKEESEIKAFLVDATAPRNLKIGNMSNCRDAGGRSNVSGGKIKQGLIYRTSETGSSPSNEIKEEMLYRFGVKTEIYVKDGNDSSSPLGSSVKFVNCSMDYGSTPYSNMARNAERLRKVFSVLGDTNNYPLFYHCHIGTDRTGICGVAINGLLGVPFDEVIQDYAFSNFGKIDGQRYPHKSSDPNGDDIAKYIDEILALPGSNFQEQTIYYLLSIGVPAQTLQTIIDFMTEGNKISIPTNVVVANGNNLTNNGGTKKTASDYKHPDIYYQISSGKSVSYEYTLSEAGKINVIAYLGCTNSSDTTKLASGIDLKIDGVSRTICDKTYYKAGFGTTKQNSRTGYMFNVLGEYDLSAGSHTIEIAGKSSDTFNIGSITLVGGLSQTNGNPRDFSPKHNFGPETAMPAADGCMAYNYSECDCGAKRISLKAVDGTFANDGSRIKDGVPEGWMKLKNNNNSVSYNFNVPANKVTIAVEACNDYWEQGDTNQQLKTMYSGTDNDDFPNIEYKISGNILDISKFKNIQYGEIFPSDNPVMDTFSGIAIIELGDIDVPYGSNTLTIRRVAANNIVIRTIYIIYEESANNVQHSFGSETAMPAANGAMAYGYSECSCGAKRISLKAIDGTFASDGSKNKSGTPSGWLKLNGNNNSISYKFNVPAGKNNYCG